MTRDGQNPARSLLTIWHITRYPSEPENLTGGPPFSVVRSLAR